MDPDKTWSEIKRIKAKIKRGTATADDREELRELQNALANWLRMGGFAPRGYGKRRR